MVAFSFVRFGLPISNVPVASCTPLEIQLAGLRRALDVLARHPCDDTGRQLVQQTEAAADRLERALALEHLGASGSLTSV